jgi:hypothetical protein
LDAKRLPANTVTYFNFRVQAWALGFDAESSPPIRILPANVIVDDKSD